MLSTDTVGGATQFTNSGTRHQLSRVPLSPPAKSVTVSVQSPLNSEPINSYKLPAGLVPVPVGL